MLFLVIFKRKRFGFPLPWDKITPANYTTWGNPPDISYLRGEAEKNMAEDSAFKLISQQALQYKKQHES